MAVIGIAALSILAYLVLQPLLIFSLRGRWRIAALIPLVAMVPLAGMTANAILHGSNLWAIALLYLLLLMLLRWLVGRRPTLAR